MKVLNFGSLNIDYVYTVDQFVRPGETLLSKDYHKFCGGKGLNQSVALAKAGVPVYHAGQIGQDGQFLKDRLQKEGVQVEHVSLIEGPSGHAIIQVNQSGENCIILHGGANQQLTREGIDDVLSHFEKNDLLLLQNEMNELGYLIEKASEQGLKVVMNPAPMNDRVLDLPLDKIDSWLVNEVEAADLAGTAAVDQALIQLREKFPKAQVVITQGAQGVIGANPGEEPVWVPAQKVKAIDTTAAGDTFIGYFLAAQLQGYSLKESLEHGSSAAAITVTKPGAAESIPQLKELS